MALVRCIITHPRIWPSASDDFCGEPDNFTPVDNPSIMYMLVYDDETLMGMWMFVPQNGICFEAHTCLLPQAYGEFAVSAAIRMTAWIWENTPAKRIVTTVPSFNRLALRLAQKAGMTQYGINPASYSKNGKLWGQILLGISKEEACPQP